MLQNFSSLEIMTNLFKRISFCDNFYSGSSRHQPCCRAYIFSHTGCGVPYWWPDSLPDYMLWHLWKRYHCKCTQPTCLIIWQISCLMPYLLYKVLNLGGGSGTCNIAKKKTTKNIYSNKCPLPICSVLCFFKESHLSIWRYFVTKLL